MGFTDAVSLHGREVSLVPLSDAHQADLVEALNDGELWRLWYTSAHGQSPSRVPAQEA